MGFSSSIRFWAVVLPLIWPGLVRGGEWSVQQRRQNCELFSEFPADTATIWSHLDDVAHELDESLRVKSSGQLIQIVLFSSQKNYESSLVARVPQCRHRKAIFVRTGEISYVYAYQSRTMYSDLRHEFAHAILHQYLPFLPLWLDEGLAEYLEEGRASRASSSRLSSVRWKTRVGFVPRLKSLEGIRSADDMDADDYRDSWAWACLLLNESDESRELLASYLERIHDGAAPVALSTILDEEFSGFSKRSNAYFRQLPLRVVSVDSKSVATPLPAAPR